MLIGQILDRNSRGVYLYTRPRRFGKSLNLSMLDAFFNMEYKDNTWFSSLEISEYSEYDRFKNAYPVVFFDFKNIECDTYEHYIEGMDDELCKLYEKYEYLGCSDKLSKSMKEDYEAIISRTPTDRQRKMALNNLTDMLFAHHDKKAIVLVDEYDRPLQNCYGMNSHKEILEFTKTMMTSLLKGNKSLQMAVLTGIMQIAKENIFSGLNNLTVNNILSKESDEMFGFTNGEIRKMCCDYGRPEKYDEAKGWYDGYRFGNSDIYNPWSVLNYIANKFEPDAYWAGTSGNDIIDTLLEKADQKISNDLRTLSEGNSVQVDMIPTLTFKDIDSAPRSIYSVMVMSGYLKAELDDDKNYHVFIPNKELFTVFANMIISKMNELTPDVRGLVNSIIRNDPEAITKRLYDLMADAISSRVLNDEHSYQAFLTGILMWLSGKYTVTADFESGNGYHDIRLISKSGQHPNILMEIKRGKNESDAESLASAALDQIRERNYAHGLSGRTICYGIAFEGKIPHISSEILEL